MGFGISTNALSRIYNFEDAEYTYNTIKPVRGNSKDIRPLGIRRAQHMRIRKIDDNTYAATLYRTDCVTYR